MHSLKYNKTDHKTHFILRANCYMFRHQADNIGELLEPEERVGLMILCFELTP